MSIWKKLPYLVPSIRRAAERDIQVLFIGKAQEKASVFRTEKRRDAHGKTYPWSIRSTAMPNHYYVYILDRDFGPLFIKFCSDFQRRGRLETESSVVPNRERCEVVRGRRSTGGIRRSGRRG